MAVDLTSRTLRHEEGPSGTVYGYVLPDVPRMKLAGGFPQTIVPLINDYLRDPIAFVSKELDDAELQHWTDFQCSLVAWMLRDIDGEACAFSPKSEEDRGLFSDPERFPIDDREWLFTAGLRIRPRPKATSADDYAKARLEAKGWTVSPPTTSTE